VATVDSFLQKFATTSLEAIAGLTTQWAAPPTAMDRRLAGPALGETLAILQPAMRIVGTLKLLGMKNVMTETFLMLTNATLTARMKLMDGPAQAETLLTRPIAIQLAETLE